MPKEGRERMRDAYSSGGITRKRAVLEQVSGNSLCLVGGPPLSPAGCSQEATGFQCFTLWPREEAGRRERGEEEEETEDWFF